jgi:hypothetical protein
MLQRVTHPQPAIRAQTGNCALIPLPDTSHGRSFDIYENKRLAIRWCRHTTLTFWNYKHYIANALLNEIEADRFPEFSAGQFALYSAEFAYWATLDPDSGYFLANIFLDPRRNWIQLPESRNALADNGWDTAICQNIIQDKLYRKIFWEEIGKLPSKKHLASGTVPETHERTLCR